MISVSEKNWQASVQTDYGKSILPNEEGGESWEALYKRLKEEIFRNEAGSIHSAADLGCERALKTILMSGVDVNAPDLVCSPRSGTYTALHYAIIAGHSSAVKILLKKGADPKLVVNRQNALELAIFSHDGKCLQAFSNRPDILDLIQNENILHEVLSGDSNGKTVAPVVKWLLEHGVDANKMDEKGFPPLHIAFGKRDCKLIDLLLDYGANPWMVDKYGNLPIGWWLLEGSPDVQADVLQKELAQCCRRYIINYSWKLLHFGADLYLLAKRTQNYFNQIWPFNRHVA